MALPKISNPNPVTIAARAETVYRDVHVERIMFQTPHGGTWSAHIQYVAYDYDTDTVEPDGEVHRKTIHDLKALAAKSEAVATAMGALLVAINETLAE